MFVRLLGPVAVGEDALSAASVAGRVQAGVLAHLTLERGHPLSWQALAEKVWDDPPASARNAIQVAVSKLRAQFGAEVVASSSPGYRVPSDGLQVDWFEAQAMISEARQDVRERVYSRALAAVRQALNLFDGEPLGDLTSHASEDARTAMSRDRREATYLEAEALIGLGQATEAVPALKKLVADDEFDERACHWLIRALAAAGEPSEAITVYHTLRGALGESLGVDPSPGNQRLFHELLDGTLGMAVPHDDPSDKPTGPAAPHPVEMDSTPDMADEAFAQGPVRDLPRTFDPILGREVELAELEQSFHEGVRLVTISGAGGVGKTRLAIALAERLADESADGVHFVDLAPVTVKETMWRTIAQHLDVPADGQVPPGFFEHLANRRVVLVLDNLEQLPDAHEVVGALLNHGPHLRLIATSRSPLRIAGEHDYPLGGLIGQEQHMQGHSQDYDYYDEHPPDVQLFLRTASRTGRGVEPTADNLSAITSLCRSLDGLPLAIQIAAARTKLFTPHVLLERVDSLLDARALDRDLPDRQRTLRQTIEWSHQLLSEPQQQLLASLSVLSGGGDLEAVEAIAPTNLRESGQVSELLLSLIENNFVTARYDMGVPRFALLETIRQYAHLQLIDSGELLPARRRHAKHFLTELFRLRKILNAGDEGAEAFSRELPNYRELLHHVEVTGTVNVEIPDAYTYAVTPREARCVMALQALMCSQPLEAIAWLEGVGQPSPSSPPDVVLATCLAHRGVALRRIGDLAGSSESLDQALALALAVFDETLSADDYPYREGAPTWNDPQRQWIYVSTETAETVRLRGDLDTARRLAMSALDSPWAPPMWEALPAAVLLLIARGERNYTDAEHWLDKCLQIDLRQGNAYGVTWCRGSQADLARSAGDPARAVEIIRENVHAFLATDDVDVASDVLHTLAMARAQQGYFNACANGLGCVQSIRSTAGYGDHPTDPEDLPLLAEALAHLGDDTWEEHFTRGRELTLEEAMSRLLELDSGRALDG